MRSAVSRQAVNPTGLAGSSEAGRPQPRGGIHVGGRLWPVVGPAHPSEGSGVANRPSRDRNGKARMDARVAVPGRRSRHGAAGRDVRLRLPRLARAVLPALHQGRAIGWRSTPSISIRSSSTSRSTGCGQRVRSAAGATGCPRGSSSRSRRVDTSRTSSVSTIPGVGGVPDGAGIDSATTRADALPTSAEPRDRHRPARPDTRAFGSGVRVGGRAAAQDLVRARLCDVLRRHDAAFVLADRRSRPITPLWTPTAGPTCGCTRGGQRRGRTTGAGRSLVGRSPGAGRPRVRLLQQRPPRLRGRQCAHVRAMITGGDRAVDVASARGRHRPGVRADRPCSHSLQGSTRNRLSGGASATPSLIASTRCIRGTRVVIVFAPSM